MSWRKEKKRLKKLQRQKKIDFALFVAKTVVSEIAKNPLMGALIANTKIEMAKTALDLQLMEISRRLVKERPFSAGGIVPGESMRASDINEYHLLPNGAHVRIKEPENERIISLEQQERLLEAVRHHNKMYKK